MNIVLDLDGVFAEYNARFRELLMSYGAPMKAFGDGPHVWDWYGPYGAKDHHIAPAVQHTKDNPAWWGSLDKHTDVTPTALDLVQWLSAFVDPLVVTYRPLDARKVSEGWIRRHLGISLPVIMSSANKAELLTALEPKVVVEDKASTLQDTRDGLEKKGLSALLLLVDRPWNQGFAQQGITRVESTEEALYQVMREARRTKQWSQAR